MLPNHSLRARLCAALMAAAIPMLQTATVAAVTAPLQIQINADKIQVRQASGQMQYLGHVHIRHGTLKVSGDGALVAVGHAGEKSITVRGRPVSVEFSKQDGQVVKLSCEELIYTSQLRQLVAKVSATMTSNEGTLSAGQLNYSLATETFSLVGTPAQPRVNAVLVVATPAIREPSSK